MKEEKKKNQQTSAVMIIRYQSFLQVKNGNCFKNGPRRHQPVTMPHELELSSCESEQVIARGERFADLSHLFC